MKVGFVTDIHEDITNLEYALKLLQDQQCEEIICLGDIVGFAVPFYKNITTRDAEACVQTVQQNCSNVVIGNHDLYAIRKVPVNKAGFQYKEEWYLLDYETRSRLSKNKIWLYEDNELPCTLSDESIQFLDSLNESAVVNLQSGSLFISHFCHPDFSGSCIEFPTEGFHLKNHLALVESNKCTLSFSGHGHPEGCLIGNQEKIISLGFGIHDLKEEVQWIVSPSIARTSRKNGVLIFDSDRMQIKAIPLSR